MSAVDRTDAYLIVKRGLYYKPKSLGYIGIRDLAGRFPLAEVATLFPNRESPNQDGMTFIHEDDAPEFSEACWDDVKAKWLMQQRDEARAEIDALRRAPVSAGKVKALQFEGHNGFWRADDGIGGYFEVTEVGGAFHMCRIVHGHANKLIPYQSQNAAFAACQVEHDRRILAQLQPGDGWQGIARPIAEWHEDMGFCVWWWWTGTEWAGEPAWIGSPLCGDWPGYHTHFTPHPEMPASLPLGEGE